MTNISQKWAESLPLLAIFANNYHQLITSSSLARKLHLPQKTVQRKLDHLLKLNLITYKREGRNKYFYLHNNPLTLEILSLVESYRTITFLQKNVLLAHLLLELSLKSPIIIFGSFADQTDKENSDLDIVICSHKRKEISDLLLQFPLVVNPHFITLEKLEQTIKEKNHLALEIVQKHIFIGKREEIILMFYNCYKEV